MIDHERKASEHLAEAAVLAERWLDAHAAREPRRKAVLDAHLSAELAEFRRHERKARVRSRARATTE